MTQPAVQVGDDRSQLTAAAMMRLIERQPPRRAILAPRDELVAGDRERAGDLVAGGVLLARDLGVRGAAPTTLGQPRAEPDAHALTRRQRSGASR